MLIYAKIGTLPGQLLRVKRLRRYPVAGKKIEVRPAYDNHAKWETVRVTEVCQDERQRRIFFLERL